MGGRGSALRWRAILLAMGCTMACLTGCMAGGTSEEHTGEVESALNDLGDDTNPPDQRWGLRPQTPASGDPGDTGDTADEADPGGPPADPEPQPWVPETAETMVTGAPAIDHGDSVKGDDPEPQPWKPPAPGDEQTPASSSSTKQH